MASPKPELIELIERATTATGNQSKAAKAAGVSAQNLNHIKQGTREAPPEVVAALAHVAGLDATEWLARATLWRCEGKPYEGVLKKALGERLRAIGGALASFLAVVALVLPPQPAEAKMFHDVYYVKFQAKECGRFDLS